MYSIRDPRYIMTVAPRNEISPSKHDTEGAHHNTADNIASLVLLSSLLLRKCPFPAFQPHWSMFLNGNASYGVSTSSTCQRTNYTWCSLLELDFATDACPGEAK